VMDYQWIRDGFTKLKTAINNGSTFYVREHAAKTATYNNIATDAFFGINMGKFFNPGQFSLPNWILATTGSNAAPRFFGYSNSTRDWVEITARTQIRSYSSIGFKIKTSAIKEVIVLGLEDMPAEEVLDLFNPEFAEYIWGWYNP